MQFTSRVNRDDPVNSDPERDSTPLRGNVSETMLPVLYDVRSLLYDFWLILPSLGRNIIDFIVYLDL